MQQNLERMIFWVFVKSSTEICCSARAAACRLKSSTRNFEDFQDYPHEGSMREIFLLIFLIFPLKMPRGVEIILERAHFFLSGTIVEQFHGNPWSSSGLELLHPVAYDKSGSRTFLKSLRVLAE